MCIYATMKRIGLLSDTHSYIDDRILHHLSEVDEIWHAGDIGKIEVTDALTELAPLRAVFGNIDGDILRREFKKDLLFTIEGMRIWMTHIGGKPFKYNRDVYQRITTNPPDLFICGHSHICKVEWDKRLNMLYMNPGAAGIHGFHKVRTLLRFSIDEGKVKDLEVVELGTK